MTSPRDRKLLSLSGLAGGVAMFLAEALIVAGFGVAAWVLSVVALALL